MRLMELQLGLALPVHSPVLKLKGFDLNDHELELNGPVASELWSHSSGCLKSDKWVKNKRSSEEAFGDLPQITTFPLTLWNGQPNEDDDRKGEKKPYILDKKEEEENHLVGWPPIKSWRMKQLHQHDHDQSGQMNNADQTAHHYQRSTGGGSSNSLYVKVKMKGVAIARKIDLRLYDSYQALKNSLITMFPNGRQNIDKDGASYALTYQDKDGDWLLAGDVPWQTFTESVQRLEILRNVDG
ncbi:auxin-responsive protein IAA29 [Juglans microcarpa x Juglans regia]|uniref:auxin-responsive protein IAA29 n=1 Tax=Juglans microcarpa x Juglans regia TaxID=2249226 RepID=UPI001B7E96A0|nr:auxin-responsive protein IAA29 [Juglans microcarpa x Juglans regia]